MTTSLEIISKARLWAEGERDIASGSDGQFALMRYQNLIDNLPLFRTGHWCDVILTSADDYAAKDGERVVPNGFDAVITLPATYTDQCGKVHVQQDLSRVQVIGKGLWVFSVSNGAWRQADGLTLESDCPFGPEDEQGLAAMLAVALASDASGSLNELSPAVTQTAQAQVNKFRSRFYRADAPRAPATYY